VLYSWELRLIVVRVWGRKINSCLFRLLGAKEARLVNKLFPSLFGRLFPVYGLDKSGRLELSDFYGYCWCSVTQKIHPLPVKSHSSRLTDWLATGGTKKLEWKYEYLTSPVLKGKYLWDAFRNPKKKSEK